jgi:hypothetical protein
MLKSCWYCFTSADTNPDRAQERAGEAIPTAL